MHLKAFVTINVDGHLEKSYVYKTQEEHESNGDCNTQNKPVVLESHKT
jgi:hypothetical protein